MTIVLQKVFTAMVMKPCYFLYVLPFYNLASCVSMEFCKPSACTEATEGQSLLQAGSHFLRSVPTEEIPRWACAVHSHQDEGSKFQMQSLAGPLHVQHLEHIVQKSSTGGENEEVQSVDTSGLEALVEKEDVLVVFYAPWCPHCQHFIMTEDAPIERLSKQLEGKAKVVKFDITANQAPTGYQVEVIPTMYFANKNVKIKYDGDPEDFGAVEKIVSENQQKKEDNDGA
eukprot:gnl/MRDRNA2_/MRDRNA2_95260_c0_seq1.p1 gnl/MRDRNA2_/MRDRNA2_95260_c0~~gnl/MRDRNA2_/MRDRNA2_95260_c0_seq1.p1  ORF type:complete len:228 (+),score=57.54 gnl/MRDRNA2_/MRDRNA2_95260_c0_seq1:112-795(+)